MCRVGCVSHNYDNKSTIILEGYILKKTEAGTKICPVCGMQYYLPDDKKDHDTYCKKFLRAQAKFGNENLMTYREQEESKGSGWDAVNNTDLSLKERINSSLLIFRGWFSRSVKGSNFSPKHPTFEKYVAMLLNQRHTEEGFPAVIYKELVRSYGMLPGIHEGKSQWTEP